MEIHLHPSSYFSLFPAFPRDQRVFVAMSFAPQFDARWSNVIAPAIEAVTIDGKPLEPHRVDLRQVSDSILTEILDGIAGCRMFVADISTIGSLDGQPVRNANVMYEVGLAQATRLPEEVLLFRSDGDPLNFDVSNVRVHRYDPEGAAAEAKTMLTGAVVSSLNEVVLGKSLAVRKIASSLDATSWAVLLSGNGGAKISPPAFRTMGDALAGARQVTAIQTLLGAGAIATEFIAFTPESVTQDSSVEEAVQYKITSLGQAVAKYGLNKMGFLTPGVLDAIRTQQAEDAPPQESAEQALPADAPSVS